jgi:hypothetical protein
VQEEQLAVRCLDPHESLDPRAAVGHQRAGKSECRRHHGLLPRRPILDPAGAGDLDCLHVGVAELGQRRHATAPEHGQPVRQEPQFVHLPGDQPISGVVAAGEDDLRQDRQ